MLESSWLTKEIYQQALVDGRVIMTANNHTRNGITEYNLYIQDPAPDMLGLRQVCGHSQYWSNNKEAYWVTCWGTSRPLEVILSVGDSLGLKHSEMEQNWKFL